MVDVLDALKAKLAEINSRIEELRREIVVLDDQRVAFETVIKVYEPVSRLRDYDGLVYAENCQVLRGDEELNAARDTGLFLDKSDFLKLSFGS